MVDLRYSPLQTELMHLFARQGWTVFNGEGMLFWQAVSAFELFTGLGAPVDTMRRALAAATGSS